MYVCLFDVDGTLLSSGGAGKAAMEAAVREVFGLAAVVDGVTYSGRTDRAIGFDLLRVHGLEPSEANLAKMHAGYLERLPHSLRRSDGRVLPGMRELLHDLQARGDVAVGLLTGNIRQGAAIKLGHFDLWHWFAFGGFGDEHLCRNEVARVALAESARHCRRQLSPDRVWVIGDTPLDVACARAIGANALAVATGWHTLEQLAPSQPDLLLADLSDPSALLERLH